MVKNLNSQYFKYIEHELKPHPKFEHMRWAVIDGKYLMVVIMEIEPGVTKERPKEKQPVHPFTGGGPHFHGEFEQVGVFMGAAPDAPDEVKTKPVFTLNNHGNELGIGGDGTLIWLPRYTVHDIAVSPEQEKAFMDEYYPQDYPKGLKFWLMDVFSPPRKDYIEYFKTQPLSFD